LRSAPLLSRLHRCNLHHHEDGDRSSGGTPEQGLAESVSCRNNGRVTSAPSHGFLNDEKKWGGSDREEDKMKWAKPVVQEVCVGMEVTSYESAEIDTVLL